MVRYAPGDIVKIDLEEDGNMGPFDIGLVVSTKDDDSEHRLFSEYCVYLILRNGALSWIHAYWLDHT